VLAIILALMPRTVGGAEQADPYERAVRVLLMQYVIALESAEDAYADPGIAWYDPTITTGKFMDGQWIPRTLEEIAADHIRKKESRQSHLKAMQDLLDQLQPKEE